MPRVRAECIASFSSEDPDHPARNLLATEISKKKWLGANKGESSNSVVLQLCKSTKIFSVNIGSYDSALVEVLVGRSERPQDPFKVLVLSSIFMSPKESKKGEGMSKVRTFNYDQLVPDTRDQNWDRVRVVCLQPYNKHIKYGLTFIHIFEPEIISNQPSSNPSSVISSLPSSQRFDINAPSSDEEESFKPGELFAKLKQNASTLSTDAEIRKASTPKALKDKDSPAQIRKTSISKDKKRRQTIDSDEIKTLKRDRDELLYTEDDQKPNDKVDRLMQKDREEKERRKAEENSKTENKRAKHKLNRTEETKQNRTEETKQKQHESHNGDNHKRKDEKNICNSDFSIFINNKTPKSKEKESSNEVNSNNKTPKNSDGSDMKNGRESHKKNAKDKDSSISDKREKIDKSKSNESEKKEIRTERSGNSSRDTRKRAHSSVKNGDSSKRLKPGPRSGSPHRLMEGVVFVMSGYVNPQRGTLRDRALAMGAKYKQDWTPDCTHLICAFPNTPKLRTVRAANSNAVVVTGEWIEECCEARRLLPWQWYATEPGRRMPKEDVDSSRSEPKEDSEECDTDDEIQKVLDSQNSQKNSKPRSTSSEIPQTEGKPEENDEPMQVSLESVTFVADERIKGQVTISDSESETFTDEETQPKSIDVQIDKDSSLPDFFDGYTFAIDPQLKDRGFDINLLKRYIIAYSGDIVEHIHEESNINYILSLNPDCDLRKLVESGTVVRPDWVWRCNDNRKKVSAKDFVIT